MLLCDAYDVAALEAITEKELAAAELEKHGAVTEQDTAIYHLAHTLTDADVS